MIIVNVLQDAIEKNEIAFCQKFCISLDSND